MSPRPKSLLVIAALFAAAFANSAPTFGMKYGSSPKATNGGHGRGCAAREKRAAKRRRNIAKRA
jgi:hypothetical protein